MEKVQTGLEILTSEPAGRLAKARLALLANQASVGPGYEHAADLIDKAFPGRLKALFGPQHGFAGEKQDNMVESDHAVGTGGRPVYSLYGETRRPTQEMLGGLDALLVDLVDVGTRVYTFAQTLAYCLEEAAAADLQVIVLDRPNPIGGIEVEGNILQEDCISFVGLHPLPMRHGMTMGELALFMAQRMDPRPDLQVIRCRGWERGMYFRQTGLPWVLPSPNMPSPETAWLYPGQVIWEGTNLSEGRGTTLPFHLSGAPWVEPLRLKKGMEDRGVEGCVLRPASFQPTFHKYQGSLCRGLEIHPLDQTAFRPYRTSLVMLEVLLELYPEQFAWRKPPYEYEYERMPMDLILGDGRVRQGLEQGRTVDELEAEWRPGLDAFCRERDKCLLY